MSGILCHEIATAAIADIEAARKGQEIADLKRIASVQHGRNLSKVVERHLRKASDLPQPLEVDVVCNTGEKATAAIELPHDYFSAMYASPDWWRRSILADESCLYRFWNAFKHHPCMDGHPVKSKKRWEAKAIPLMFYGDEVPVVGVGKVWSRCVIMFEGFLFWQKLQELPQRM